MNIKEHVHSHYLGDDQLIVDLRPNENQDEDNPHYFTAIYLKLCEILNCEDTELTAEYNEYINRCRVDDFGKTVHGLFHRFPYESEFYNRQWKLGESGTIRLTSQEELMAIAMFDRSLAKEIYEYGKHNYYSWDNRCPNEWTFRSFLGRFLEFIPYLKMRSGIKLSLLNKLCFCIMMIKCTFQDKTWTNSRLKMWVASLESRESSSFFVRKATEFYLNHMKKTYGTLGNFLGHYFPKDHPFSVYTIDKEF